MSWLESGLKSLRSDQHPWQWFAASVAAGYALGRSTNGDITRAVMRQLVITSITALARELLLKPQRPPLWEEEGP